MQGIIANVWGNALMRDTGYWIPETSHWGKGSGNPSQLIIFMGTSNSVLIFYKKNLILFTLFGIP
jgi:hypothetical protein